MTAFGNVNRYPHISLFAVLAVILLIPFLLRRQHQHLEIYPSVNLPIGAGPMHVDSPTVTRPALLLQCTDNESGLPKRLDHIEFLTPVPPWYIRQILQNRLGLLTSAPRSYKLPLVPVTLTKRDRASDSDRAQTAQWVKERLRAADCVDSLIVITRAQVELVTRTRDITAIETIDEISIALD